jgi:hypothetical protein
MMGSHRAGTQLRRTGLAVGTAAAAAGAIAGFAAAATLPVTSQRIVGVSRAETVPVISCTVSSPAADTYTSQSSTGTQYGAATELRVASRTNQARRTFVRFDLAGCAIPTTAVVQSASLRLVMGTAPSASRTYGAYRLTSSWAENALTWASAQPTASATATGTAATGTTAGVTLSWNVATDVQAHVTTPASNFGWVLRDLNETGSSTFESVFHSREHGTAGQRPSLVVTYYR